MRILFVDSQLPGHFRHLPGYLAAQGGHDVAFLHQDAVIAVWPGVRSVPFGNVRLPRDTTNPLLRVYESAVLGGRSAFRAASELAAEGFVPDVIVAFTGWGPPMFLREVFPGARIIAYNDWYNWPTDSAFDFFPERPLTFGRAARVHLSNASTLMELADADWLMVTTRWQLAQFPLVFWPRASVLHDGIDTELFSPGPSVGLRTASIDLRGVEELVTYATRGMEPYRGFEQFLRAVQILQRQRPRCHVVVAGTEGTYYSWKAPDGASWKDHLLPQLDLDLSRIHFTGALSQEQMVQLLRASSAHVYLSAPYLPSWSLFEAMATGCIVVASDTGPVREAIDPDVHGLLVDFFDVDALAARLQDALERRSELSVMGVRGRQRIVDRYSLPSVLPRQAQLLADVLAGKAPSEVEGSAAPFAAQGHAEEVPV